MNKILTLFKISKSPWDTEQYYHFECLFFLSFT